jgi:hypothetical protein
MRSDQNQSVSSTAAASKGFALTFAGLGTFMAMTLWAKLPAAVATHWVEEHSQTFHTVWPQNWSFFSNFADAAVTTTYRVRSDGTVTSSTAELTMSSQDRWGLGRTAQAKLLEMLRLAEQIPGDYWIRCSQPLSQACLAEARTYSLTNKYLPATLCGRIVFVRTEPMSVSAKSGRAATPGSVAVVDVTCAT